jgi:PleD family two-component response regulator
MAAVCLEKCKSMTTEPFPSSAEQKKLRVLLVEDDADTLATTLKLLEAMGHWATGVRSAEAAIARFFDGAFDVACPSRP